jgi:hypothetical protein
VSLNLFYSVSTYNFCCSVLNDVQCGSNEMLIYRAADTHLPSLIIIKNYSTFCGLLETNEDQIRTEPYSHKLLDQPENLENGSKTA